MQQENLYFSFGDIRLCHSVYGQGGKTLLAFHGYGQGKEYFAGWAQSIGKEYTIISFDLFFHGQSIWPYGDTPLSKDQWHALMEAFLKEQGIAQFSIAGFSLGGKFALAILESFTDRVAELFLIAPDGIKTNFWYSLATYPMAFRKLFKLSINRPSLFFKLAKGLKMLRLLDKGIIKFSETQMDSKEKRSRVYHSWVVFRKFHFDQPKLAATINQFEVPLIFYMGKFDKIISVANLKRFVSQVPHRMVVLETGHNNLIKDVGDHWMEQNPGIGPE